MLCIGAREKEKDLNEIKVFQTNPRFSWWQFPLRFYKEEP